MHAADGGKDFARRAAELCGGALKAPMPSASARVLCLSNLRAGRGILNRVAHLRHTCANRVRFGEVFRLLRVLPRLQKRLDLRVLIAAVKRHGEGTRLGLLLFQLLAARIALLHNVQPQHGVKPSQRFQLGVVVGIVLQRVIQRRHRQRRVQIVVQRSAELRVQRLQRFLVDLRARRLQRSDLGVFEEAEGIEKLVTLWNTDREEAARRLGMAPSTLSNKLRLLKLPGEARKIITENGLSERHARELLRLSSSKEQIKAAEHIVKKGFNVAETERYITSLCTAKKKAQKPVYIVKDVRVFINTFERAIGIMKNSGINAVSTMTESEDNIIYTVSIPKNSAFQKQRRTKPIKTAPAYSACAPSVI